MRTRRITLTIDRIVVTGSRPSRAALSAAIQAELRKSLLQPGATDALGAARDVPRMDAGRVASKAGGVGSTVLGARSLGTAIAEATSEALTR